jgi:serine protease Do
VEGAQDIKVSLKGQDKEFQTKVVGRDPKTDVAVIKIDAKDLPSVTFADSSKVEVGDVVLAIGNPFGVGQTVTMGIVSAVGRGGMGIEDYEDFIQTDAAINPGNSGGALVDADGRLIGINTAILSHNGGNQGVGFAIPANLVRNVTDQLIAKGRVERGYLGVMIQNVTPELAKAFKDAKTGGALIGEVTPKSAAAEAGLKDGDIITEFNGKPVRDSRSLRLMVAEMAPGTKIPMKVLRDGKEMTFNIALREMPSKMLASTESAPSHEQNADVLNGVTVSDLDAGTRDAYNLPKRLNGAVITGIEPGSAAYEAGLREGDVIQEIGHKPVANADQAVAASEHAKGKQALLRVWGHGGSHYVVVDETKAG